MKGYVLLLCFGLFSAQVQAQNFEDDFTDGNFTINPVWSGADSNFVIFELNGNAVLRLNGNEADTSYLSTPSTNIEGFWEFFVRIDGSAPSGSNKAEVILMSDLADLSGAFNGYGIRVGQTGEDVFHLVRYDGGTETTIVLSDTTVFQAGGSYRIKVTRDASGNWLLEVGVGYNGELKNAGTSAQDTTYTTSSFFGVKVSYTSSRADDFYFDFKIDTPPVIIDPFILQMLAVFSETELDLTFNRAVDFSSVAATDFLLNGSINPTSVTNLASTTMRLLFGDEFAGGASELALSGIEPANNDTVLTDTTLTFFVFEEYETGDVLINEFLKDPPTGSGIPEYVEIVNTSARVLNLKDWKIGDNSALNTISDTNFVLLPDTFLVLTTNPENLESVFGEVYAHDVSLPSLNNTTDQIRLAASDGSMADSLEYSPNWGGVDVALERRSLEVASTFAANWGDSPNNQSGTPGRKNEIEPDITPPDLASFIILNDSTFQLIFTEEIKSAPASNPDNFSISFPVSASVQTQAEQNDFVVATFFEPDTVILEFKQSVYTGSNPSVLIIENQEDVFGNIAESIQRSYELIPTDDPMPGDIVINEIMYKPPSGFSEFVEIYVPGNKSFNLKGWTISDNSGAEIEITENTFYIKNDDIDIFSSERAPNPYVILVPDSTIQKNAQQRIVVGSRFPSLNNSGDAIVLKDPNGTVIDSLTYFSSWGGDEVSLERRSPELPPTLRQNWGDHPTDNLASPAQVNALGLDEEAPSLLAYMILADRKMELIFNEELLDTSATNIANFGLTHPMSASPVLIRPVEVDFAAPDTIRLTFENAFFELNLLEVFNQTDYFGNRNDRIAFEFEYVVTSPAIEGEVKITEFAYDAPAEFSEFVEIYNPTNKNFDLQGWTFNDNTGNRKRITNNRFFLKAGEYAVLAPDSTIFYNFGELKLLDVPGFPALNNTTDNLVLRNASGVLMDSLSYSREWGGEEVTLERRSVDVAGIYAENWGNSPAQVLGTPGAPNKIAPDTEAPKVIEAAFVSDTQIQLIFDERLFGDESSNPENYYSEAGPNPATATARGDTVWLLYESPFTDGQAFEMYVRNLADIFGNVQTGQPISMRYVRVGDAGYGDVVINEILYRRADELAPEFVELFNRSDMNYDLSGWNMADAGNSTTRIPAGTILKAGEYLVLTDREAFAENLANVIYLPDFPNLNDSGDGLILKNTSSFTIDSLFYRSAWGGDEPGVSLERKDPRAPSADPANWASSRASGGNSAGLPSSVFTEDTRPPEIIFASQQLDGILVVFNEFVLIDEETTFLVQGTSVENITYSSSKPSQVFLNISAADVESGDDGSDFEIRVGNVADYKGNVASEISRLIAVTISGSGLVINEIMYNPLANSEDNLPDQTEYIELYNPGDRAISLEGVYLHDAPDELDEVRAVIPVSTNFSWIAPGGFTLLYAEDEVSEFKESRLARYFLMEGDDTRFAIRVDRSSLSLGSTGDAIFLADSSGLVIDSVFFDESWQNPNVFDTRGIALERIDPLGPSNDASNWSSSTHVSGGTPMAQNSIFQQAGTAPDEVGISFNPNPFSPDEDGFEDNLFINYTLDAPDYLLRVRIFDRYGREVRELVEGYQAGFEGSLIWDGLTDDRSKNRVGIYIVLFEAYDSAIGQNRTFKKTVVLARKF